MQIPQESRNGSAIAFNPYLHVFRRVEHPTGKFAFGGKLINKRSKADPLHNSTNTDLNGAGAPVRHSHSLISFSWQLSHGILALEFMFKLARYREYLNEALSARYRSFVPL